MKKIFQNICVILTITILLFNFSGCYDATGIEELAYVVALGLDLTENNELELSVQIATSGSGDSSKSSSGDSAGSSSQSKGSNVTTVKCDTINSRSFTNQQPY